MNHMIKIFNIYEESQMIERLKDEEKLKLKKVIKFIKVIN